MASKCRWLSLAALVVAAAVLFFPVPRSVHAAGVAECLECHDGIQEAAFSASPHAKIQCVGCHSEITDISKHENGEIEIKPVECTKCHKAAAEPLMASVHSGEGCTGCHLADQVHAMPAKFSGQDSVKICSECH